jgi:hypothetical protein
MRGKALVTGLIVCVLLTLQPASAATATTVTDVAGLKAALQNPVGSNIRLGADILFTTADARDGEYGVVIEGGDHTIDLNGHTITYAYISTNRKGTPILLQDGTLTINGSGSVRGGRIALEVGGGFSSLTVNGGSYHGEDEGGLRIRGGWAVINAGTFTGRFNGAWLEEGLLVINGGTIQSIRRGRGSLIEQGVLTGNAALHLPLTLTALTIPSGSSLTVTQGALLMITGALTGRERLIHQGGLVAVGGDGVVRGQVILNRDLTLVSLTVEPGGEIIIDEGYSLTVTGPLLNNGMVQVWHGARLDVKGRITNNGEIRGLADEPAGDGQDRGLFFSDVKEGDWFYPYVTHLASAGIISGMGDGSFAPQGEVTFGQALKLILMATSGGRAEAPTGAHWASGYLDRALAISVLDRPVDLDAYISRLAVAEMAARAMGLPLTTDQSPFADVESRHASALYHAGIMQGSFDSAGNRLFKPDSTITRAEIAAVVKRIYDASIPQ